MFIYDLLVAARVTPRASMKQNVLRTIFPKFQRAKVLVSGALKRTLEQFKSVPWGAQFRKAAGRVGPPFRNVNACN
jgi:hypothetical protein